MSKRDKIENAKRREKQNSKLNAIRKMAQGAKQTRGDGRYGSPTQIALRVEKDEKKDEARGRQPKKGRVNKATTAITSTR